MLTVENLHVSYGDNHVLRGVSCYLGEGEVLGVFGPNGSGKSTLIGALSGIVPKQAGRVLMSGEDVSALPTEAILDRGIALVPQGRRLFNSMTVHENLELGAYTHLGDRPRVSAQLEVCLEVFPELRTRLKHKAGTLSGGQQQMVAIARGLMSEAKVLLMDEPSLGVAPIVVDLILEMLDRLRSKVGLSVILVEQNVTAALRVTDRIMILKHGVSGFDSLTTDDELTPDEVFEHFFTID